MSQLNLGEKQILGSGLDMSFALIIDGKALGYALEDGMKKKFLQIAIKCASVICCRVSPKQKALVWPSTEVSFFFYQSCDGRLW